MIESLTRIAPLTSWGLVVLASGLILAAAVALGHALLARRAYGERFDGPAGAGTLPSMSRWALGLLAAGLAATGMLLGWPALVVILLAATATIPLGVEAAVRVIG